MLKLMSLCNWQIEETNFYTWKTNNNVKCSHRNAFFTGVINLMLIYILLTFNSGTAAVYLFLEKKIFKEISTKKYTYRNVLVVIDLWDQMSLGFICFLIMGDLRLRADPNPDIWYEEIIYEA